MKVVGIEKGKKPGEPEHCPFCWKTPACPGWTCPRIASVTYDDANTLWTVEFVDDSEDEPAPAA